MGLITAIVNSPATGLMFVLKQIANEVDRELYDETLWQQKLLDLQLRYDIGEFGDAELEEQENVIMAQLDVIHQRKEAMAREEILV